MDKPPYTQHELNEHERDTRSATPEVDDLMARINRGARFHRELAGFVSEGATVVPDLTNDQAGKYGPVFAARMSVVIEVWRKQADGNCSQMLSNAIIGLLRAMEEAAAEPMTGPDTLEACASSGD